MKLLDLLDGISVKNEVTSLNPEISTICFDSRKVVDGALFVAQKGTISDGHDYIGQVVDKGAKAIVCEVLPTSLQSDVCYIQVENSDDALGKIACNWYDNPSKKLNLVGVTGTNGKTTIASLLYETFEKLGYQVGLLSTVVNRIHDVSVEATHTTPDAMTLNQLLDQMVQAGCTYAFMEVSSHSVEQRRIAGLHFVGGIFTNLTRDHLDYHLTFENYLKAKKAFFDGLPKGAFALTNADDKNGDVMLQNTQARKFDYSTQTLADFKAQVLEQHFEGMQLDINGKEVLVQFIGLFNVSNLLAIYGAACLLEQNPDEVLLVLSTLKPVSGRLEYMQSPKGFLAIVDYAHTPDALKNVLKSINELTQGRVITVVGAGGNRDKGKRPMMAKEALNGSHFVVLTSDNPRFEEPQSILDDMLTGVEWTDKKKVLTILDRKEAIRAACMMAAPGDVILVAGKGHENYQDIKGVKYPFDDKQILQEIFQLMS